MGQVVYSNDIAVTDGLYEGEINTSRFASGIYLVKVEKSGQIKYVKAVKQ
jgi:hypothetical protein